MAQRPGGIIIINMISTIIFKFNNNIISYFDLVKENVYDKYFATTSLNKSFCVSFNLCKHSVDQFTFTVLKNFLYVYYL